MTASQPGRQVRHRGRNIPATMTPSVSPTRIQRSASDDDAPQVAFDIYAGWPTARSSSTGTTCSPSIYFKLVRTAARPMVAGTQVTKDLARTTGRTRRLTKASSTGNTVLIRGEPRPDRKGDIDGDDYIQATTRRLMTVDQRSRRRARGRMADANLFHAHHETAPPLWRGKFRPGNVRTRNWRQADGILRSVPPMDKIWKIAVH